MHSSRAVNLSWRFTAPDSLYSNRSREMWKIEEDLTQENYCGGGFCSEHLNIARYGEAGKGAPNSPSDFGGAVRGDGLGRGGFNGRAGLNNFLTWATPAGGRMAIPSPQGKQRDSKGGRAR